MAMEAVKESLAAGFADPIINVAPPAGVLAPAPAPAGPSTTHREVQRAAADIANSKPEPVSARR